MANALEGEAEIAGKAANPRIVEMFRVAGLPDDPASGSDDTAWCAAFANACLRCSGYQGTKSALASSFAAFGADLGRTPQSGCIVLFKPMAEGASGHVAFFVADDGDSIKVLGGNQSDQVKVASFSKNKWRAYRWPSQTAPLPETTLPTILSLAPNQAPDHVHAAGAPRAEPPPLIRPAVADNFGRVQPVIEQWEGGYSDHPADPGGATNMGITQEVLREWRHQDVTKDDVKALQRDEARQIYRARYWQPLRCDEMPIALALMTYNAGVNCGIGRGARWLQEALNKQGEGLDVDGEVGPLTLSACARADVTRAVNDFAADAGSLLSQPGHLRHLRQGLAEPADRREVQGACHGIRASRQCRGCTSAWSPRAVPASRRIADRKSPTADTLIELTYAAHPATGEQVGDRQSTP